MWSKTMEILKVGESANLLLDSSADFTNRIFKFQPKISKNLEGPRSQAIAQIDQWTTYFLNQKSLYMCKLLQFL